MPNITKTHKSKFSLYEACKPQFSKVAISIDSKTNIGLMKNETKLEVKNNGRISYAK